MKQREMPMLAGIAGMIRWVEELANLLSGPLLTLGLGIALIDLLTDGSLLARLPLLLYAWAVSQAVGVDAQLVATWDRARLALREGQYWALLGLIVLGGVLAYVAWVAAQVFALQESEGVTTGVALARLGMDSAGWLVQRTALSVLLVCLAGWTRYHPPAKDVAAEAEAERQQLEADLLLEPLRQQVRAQQARGMRGVVAAALGRDTASDFAATPALVQAEVEQVEHVEPSTRPRSPVRKRPSQGVSKGTLISPAGNVVQMAAPRRRASRRNKATGRSAPVSAESRARAAYKPGMTAGELSRAAGIGMSAASKWRTVLAAESVVASSADQAIR
jgi:hypothetical protein